MVGRKEGLVGGKLREDFGEVDKEKEDLEGCVTPIGFWALDVVERKDFVCGV